MVKQIITGREARLQILNGINKAVDAIRPTLGAEGKNIIVPTDFGYQATDDGLTGARAIELEGGEEIGAAFVKELTLGMETSLGGGRTTAAVLLQKLCQELFKVEYSNRLKGEIKEAQDILIAKLKKSASPVTAKDLEKIATSACLDPDAGKIIADTINQIGVDGQLTVEPNDKPGISLEMVSGMKVGSGLANPYMMTDFRKGEGVAEKPFVLVTNQIIAKQDQLLPIIQKLEAANIFSLVIFCDQIEGDALALACTLTQNKKFIILGVSTKFLMGDKKSVLEDIAVLTGAKLLNEGSGLPWDKVQPSHLGQARQVIVGKDSTLIVDGAGEPSRIQGLIKFLKQDMKLAPESKKDTNRERIANLTGGVGIIRMGIPTPNEYAVKKHKIEDAIAEVKCALEEGVVIGGGSLLAKLSLELPKTQGGKILSRSIIAPLMVMADNATLDPNEILADVRTAPSHSGYDFKNQVLTDLVKAGVLDALKVSRIGLDKAISLALAFISTETIIVKVKDDGKS